MLYRIAQQNTMNIVKEIKLVVFCSNSTIAKTSIVTSDNDHGIALTTTALQCIKHIESTYLYHSTPTLCGTDNDETYVFCILCGAVAFRVAIYRPHL
jgi:hypothetical protein